mgnify:CR=1 FL=1
MKYDELLELYKKKELSGEQQEMVEQDIERHEAISEYLFEKEEEDILQDSGKLPEESAIRFTEKEKKAADDFTKRVNRAVRRAFLKMGAAVCAVTLVVVLLVLFVLPHVVSSFYYDPGRIVGESSYGGTTNQMSLDLAVYTELALPGAYRDNVQVEDRGYGNYDINIYQSVSRSGEFHHVAGRVEKNNLKMYDINLLNMPSSNIFGWFQMNMDRKDTLTEQVENGAGSFAYTPESKEQSAEDLKLLDDNKYYLAYVTLDKILPYNDFIEFAENYSERAIDVWCVPRTAEESYMPIGRPANLGFCIQLGQSSMLEWNREKYPDLILWSFDDTSEWDEAEEKIKDETFAAEHFTVMLDYMSGQDEFLGMVGQQAGEKYAEAADYIRENGLQVYGFACVADKETLLELNAEEEVFGIRTEEAE